MMKQHVPSNPVQPWKISIVPRKMVESAPSNTEYLGRGIMGIMRIRPPKAVREHCVVMALVDSSEVVGPRQRCSRGSCVFYTLRSRITKILTPFPKRISDLCGILDP